ncbi:sodium-dependent proline transporter-like isoform X2 [Paroedura picta]|uniref:sodium-dependent proline transporter-like isoform X2 n=1 Tax=Paroedura picta TaxID=143630 RepID=UPI0040566A3E
MGAQRPLRISRPLGSRSGRSPGQPTRGVGKPGGEVSDAGGRPGSAGKLKRRLRHLAWMVELNETVLEASHPPPSAGPAQSQPVAPPPGPDRPRDTWGGKYEFLLSCLGYCVGLGNVWRFPYLCYRNGGGVFLIPYGLMLLFTGLPLFLMELSLGQYGAAGPITVWKCCPLLKGIGIGMLVVSSLVTLYYNVILAWTFYYLGMSLQSPLPWSCQAPPNAPLCQAQNVSLGNASRSSASEAFWNEQVLGVVRSSGLGDPGAVRWPLALCLLLAWLVVFLCTLRGIRSSGKVVYFTATFPYLVIVVLIIRGATLEGSIDGVRFYLSADWSRLHSAQVWSDAASQIFYSLGIGFGGLLSMASYNKFDNNVIRDTLVIALGNCGTSFFAGFAIFSILGHMAWRKKVPVGEVAETGPGLAFVAYPEALALLPGSAFWSVLFFLMLFTLGIDTLFGNMEGIVTAVMDEFPSLRDFRRKALFLGGLCLAFYCLGLLLVTEGGIYWFTLLDAYSTSFGLIVIVLFMCLGMAFFYGVNQFCQDIVDMIRLCPPWCSRLLLCFKACWVVVTPGLLLFTLFYIFLDLSSTRLHYGPYQYPRWGEALGVCLGVVTCVQIPLWAGVALCKESGTLADRFRKAIHPLNSWRATNGRDLSHHVIDVPYTVNLTDHDSLGAWQLQGSSEA